MASAAVASPTPATNGVHKEAAADSTTALPVKDVPPPQCESPLPTREELNRCADFKVLDGDGKEHRCGELYASEGKHLFIFIRHFFCGMCQDYLAHFCQHLPPSSLPSNVHITVVGCGAPTLIPKYVEATGCEYPIYADPDRRLYDALEMNSNLSLGEHRPDYQIRNMPVQIIKSIIQGLSSGRDAVKGGKTNQLGGEWLIETTKGGEANITWGWRMRNTRGHTDVETIKKVLEL